MDEMIIRENISQAIDKSLQNKKKDPQAQRVLKNKEKYIDLFLEKINAQSYQFKKGKEKTIRSEKKDRIIQIPEIHDHMMQHIILHVLSPVIMKSMYEYNAGVIPGRGPIFAKRYLEKSIKKEKYKYCLKLDIEKYFHNISTGLLIKQLERKIKDKDFLELVKSMLNTANGDSGIGIPIGSYSSQWLSNFYLESLDYFIKQELVVDVYVRYMDDMVILGNNKRKLNRVRDRILRKLEEMGLKSNGKHQVFPIASRRIDFVGYMIGPKDTKVRKEIFRNFKRRSKALDKEINIFLCRSYLSLRGWLVHSDRGRAYLKANEPPNRMAIITKYISDYDKKKEVKKWN